MPLLIKKKKKIDRNIDDSEINNFIIVSIFFSIRIFIGIIIMTYYF